MTPTGTIDYVALAQQYGGVPAGAPPVAPKPPAPNYDDLARRFGGSRVSAGPAPVAPAPQPDKSNLSYDTGPLAGQTIPGLMERGNIDVNHRPSITNDDGSHSSIYSVTTPINEDGSPWKGEYEKAPRYALVPSIANGKFLTPDGKMPPKGDKRAQQALEDAATDYYAKTREHLGIFGSSDAADKYADATHAYMNDGSARKVFAPSYTGNSNLEEPAQATQPPVNRFDTSQAPPLSSRYTAAEGAFTPGVGTGPKAIEQIASGVKTLAPGPAPAKLSERYIPGAGADTTVNPQKTKAVTDIAQGAMTLAEPTLLAGFANAPAPVAPKPPTTPNKPQPAPDGTRRKAPDGTVEIKRDGKWVAETRAAS